jgi:putative transposase
MSTLLGRFNRQYLLSDVMRDFKRHTARQIIRRLGAEDKSQLLELLRGMNDDQRQEYKVWEDGYDARDVFSLPFLEQKMDYIHLQSMSIALAVGRKP